MREQESTTTLPGIFATISAGFDLTARHLWLLIVPVILDVFYWLGPRLRFQELIEQLLVLLPAEAEVLELGTQLADAAPHTNLFTSLTVQLIGVPALMIGLAPEVTPLAAQFYDVNNWSTWLGLFLVFSLAGLLLTALFYTLIASVVSEQIPPLSAGHWSKRILSSWLRLIGLALIFLFVIIALYIPLIFIGTILYLINNTLGINCPIGSTINHCLGRDHFVHGTIWHCSERPSCAAGNSRKCAPGTGLFTLRSVPALFHFCHRRHLGLAAVQR